MYKAQTPDLSSLIKSLRSLPVFGKHMLDDFAKKEAELMHRKVQEHISMQDLNWKPLSPDYIKAKKSEGLDDRTWIATGELRSRIKVHKLKNSYYVGGKPSEIHEGSGMLVNDLIKLLEYGSVASNLPPRPVFAPTQQELNKWLFKRFRDYTKSKMLSHFKIK